ncbi:MAG TPA: conjugal transfer protein TraD [Inquilinus sp.]
MSEDRKRDAREKIALGGLVTKAGLRRADKAFIFGVLMEAAKIPPADPEYERLRMIGDAAFDPGPPI